MTRTNANRRSACNRRQETPPTRKDSTKSSSDNQPKPFTTVRTADPTPMNAAIWRSLLWKEWREHRWKLAALVVVVIGLHVWALDATEPEAAHYVSPFWATLYLVVPIGSVFLAISLAASEQSQGTAPFLRSLPINLRWLAVIKLVISVATIIAVLSLAAALTRALVAAAEAYGWQSDEGSLRSLDSLRGLFETGGWFFSALLIGGAVSASLILWMAAPAVNSKSEVRAGLD
jgi:hypothetical protein